MKRSSVQQLAATVACVVAMLAPSSAGAHVQIEPQVAAPADPIRVSIIVPNERTQSTTKVTVQVPEGVIPFSFGETPNWKRRVINAPNGSIRELEWTGRLASDGFVRFELLATTPDAPGVITWKALQEYEDGEVAKWIGASDTDMPAATMNIDASAPRQNAGGEGAAAVADEQPAKQSSDTSGDSAREPDWIARGLAIVAAIATIGAIVISRRRRSAV